MKIIIRLYFFLTIIGLVELCAQQDPHYTQYMFNTMSVNPAYAGSRGHGVITALCRSQWVGFNGAPDTQNLSFDTPLGYSGLGLGINLLNDKIGPSDEFYFDVNGSYNIETDQQGNLAFGLRLGGRILNIDWSKGQVDENEPIFANNISGRFLPTVGAGVYYHEPKWYLGLSVPNFLKSEHYDGNLQSLQTTAVERMHFYFIGGYVFDVTENIRLKPAILLKAVSGAPLSLDVSVTAMFNQKFRAGLAWRWDDSISALLGFQVSKSFLIGYAYDLTTSNYNVTNSGTHEIMIRYDIFKDLTYRSPRFF